MEASATLVGVVVEWLYHPVDFAVSLLPEARLFLAFILPLQ